MKTLLTTLLLLTTLTASAQWTYSSIPDPMSQDTTRIALLYNEPGTATILVRQRGNRTEVILGATQETFVLSEGYFRFRFDDDKAHAWNVNPTFDYNGHLCFINSPGSFVKQLRKSRKLVMEATVYDKGRAYYEFNVEGLK